MIAGQLKLNLDLAAGEPVSLGVQDDHFDRRGDLLPLPGVRWLSPESQADRLGTAATSSTTAAALAPRRRAEAHDPNPGDHGIQGVDTG